MKPEPCAHIETGDACAYTAYLKKEIEHFSHLLEPLIPVQRTMPNIPGVDIHGENLPLNDVGGDLLLFFDFKERYAIPTLNHPRHQERLEQTKQKAGIAVIDSSGHSATTSYLASAFYYALSTGILYELEEHGEITPGLFEKLNHIFYNQDGIFLTMTYGEIAGDGTFRYLQAANPPPKVFSYEYNRFMELGEEQLRGSLPLGLAPSESYRDHKHTLTKQKYSVNELRLKSPGDIILLTTDGLADHEGHNYDVRLEEIIRNVKDANAHDIAHAIREDLQKYAPQQDDISYVVVKKV